MPKKIKVEINYKVVLFTIFLLLLIYFINKILGVLLMFFFAFILNAGLKPLVIKLEKVGIPRWLCITVIYLLLTAFITVVFVNIVVEIVNQFQSLKGILGGADEEIVNFIKDNFPSLAEKLDLNASTSNSALTTIGSVSNITAQNVFETVLKTVSQGADIIGSVTGGILSIITVIILSIYMLTDKRDIYAGIIELLPSKYQMYVIRVVKRIEKSLGNWFLGQLSLMLLIGLATYFFIMIPRFFVSGYELHKYALLLALVSGILEGLPSLGPTITLIVITSISLLTGAPIGITIYLAIAFLSLQQAEAVFIVPMVMKNAVNVNPIISILGIFAGLNLDGPVGALIAIPLIATLQIVVMEVANILKNKKAFDKAEDDI